jgi:membrane protein DedA with SNARE-associated domain
MTRAHYLTLGALSLIASVSLFVSVALVFGLFPDELVNSVLFSLILPLVVPSPFILIALRFFRKAETQRARARATINME